jgi:hypothetical protein
MMPKGFHHTEETKKKMSRRHMGKSNFSPTGEDHPRWKGDRAGAHSIHRWVEKRLQKPSACPECKRVVSLELVYYDHLVGTRRGTYKRDVLCFQWLCRRCHVTKDGRLKYLEDGRKLRWKR